MPYFSIRGGFFSISFSVQLIYSASTYLRHPWRHLPVSRQFWSHVLEKRDLGQAMLHQDQEGVHGASLRWRPEDAVLLGKLHQEYQQGPVETRGVHTDHREGYRDRQRYRRVGNITDVLYLSNITWVLLLISRVQIWSVEFCFDLL